MAIRTMVAWTLTNVASFPMLVDLAPFALMWRVAIVVNVPSATKEMHVLRAGVLTLTNVYVPRADVMPNVRTPMAVLNVCVLMVMPVIHLTIVKVCVL